MTNSFKYTPQAPDVALRGNMGSANFLERSSGHKKLGLTRSEIIRQVRAARPETTKKYPTRIANVRRLPSISGFHVIGLGDLPNTTLNQLKAKLRVGTKNFAGCTGYRVGGLTFKLFS